MTTVLVTLIQNAALLETQDTAAPRHPERLQSIMKTASAGIGMVENRVIVLFLTK